MPFVPRDDIEAAIQDAAECGGKFLDGLNKFDLTTLSFDEWMTFVATICREYDDNYELRTGNQAEAATAKVENWSNRTPTQRSPGPLWASPGYFPRAMDLDDEIPF